MWSESSNAQFQPKKLTFAILRTCLLMIWVGGNGFYYFFVRGEDGSARSRGDGLIVGILIWFFIVSVAELDHRVKGGMGTVFQKPFWAWFGIAWAVGSLAYCAYLFLS